MNITDNQKSFSLPNFSIIVETENLSTAELEGLFQCLRSLEKQEISLAQANEVLILESGDLSKSILEEICTEFPWLTIHSIENELEYYEAKMKGVALTTGDIIVFCDSDCVYESVWLKNLLTPFVENSEIQITAGETSIAISNAYDLAIAMIYIFPRFTQKEDLYTGFGYYFNNVAFRRSLLIHSPLPSYLPLYRGNCVIHANSLKRQGHQIWIQPKSRATHAPPNGFIHFIWRFWFLGYDALTISRLMKDASVNHSFLINLYSDLAACLRIKLNEWTKLTTRLYLIAKENSFLLLHLPLALPIVAMALFSFSIGLVFSLFRPASAVQFTSQKATIN